MKGIGLDLSFCPLWIGEIHKNMKWLKKAIEGLQEIK